MGEALIRGFVRVRAGGAAPLLLLHDGAFASLRSCCRTALLTCLAVPAHLPCILSRCSQRSAARGASAPASETWSGWMYWSASVRWGAGRQFAVVQPCMDASASAAAHTSQPCDTCRPLACRHRQRVWGRHRGRQQGRCRVQPNRGAVHQAAGDARGAAVAGAARDGAAPGDQHRRGCAVWSLVAWKCGRLVWGCRRAIACTAANVVCTLF